MNVLDALAATLETHSPCTWKQVGPCVYCNEHGVRLYQGQLPTDRKPKCKEHDWNEESGLGFYFQCRKCGLMEWPED